MIVDQLFSCRAVASMRQDETISINFSNPLRKTIYPPKHPKIPHMKRDFLSFSVNLKLFFEFFVKRKKAAYFCVKVFSEEV